MHVLAMAPETGKKVERVEQRGFHLPGAVMLVVEAVLFLLALGGLFSFALGRLDQTAGTGGGVTALLLPLIAVILGVVVVRGFRVLRSDQVLVLYSGKRYRGTVKQTGLIWTNPLVSLRKISVQAHRSTVQHTFDWGATSTADVTWKISDTAKAIAMSGNFDEAVRKAIDTALSDSRGENVEGQFQQAADRELKKLGVTAEKIDLKTGKVVF